MRAIFFGPNRVLAFVVAVVECSCQFLHGPAHRDGEQYHFLVHFTIADLLKGQNPVQFFAVKFLPVLALDVSSCASLFQSIDIISCMPVGCSESFLFVQK